MAKFVTIGGGKIKRAKGRFGGESAWSRDQHGFDRRYHLPAMHRRLALADRHFAAMAFEDDPSDCLSTRLLEDRLANAVVARIRCPVVMRNNRHIQAYPDGMRIHSARF